MDRSTMATLNTYNTRMYLTRPVMIVVAPYFCYEKTKTTNSQNAVLVNKNSALLEKNKTAI